MGFRGHGFRRFWVKGCLGLRCIGRWRKGLGFMVSVLGCRGYG